MTKGQIIELRLQQRRCIKCGLNPSIDWPYICGECVKAMADEQAAKRRKLQGDDDPWVIH
jgi:hypothetical protein